MRKLKTLIKGAFIGLAVAALVQELRKPAEEREWHGRVANFVPYDFRFPTIERILSAYWNPDEPRIFTDRVLGVGWAINLGRLYAMARQCCQISGEREEDETE